MRGKKTDPEFVSQFISQCLQQNIFTTLDIIQQARQNIKEIDDKIIEVEKLKTLRTKLLDVISTLEKPKVEPEDTKILPLFKLQYPRTCKKICNHVKDAAPNYIYSVLDVRDPEVLFCIKQLVEAQVIVRVDNHLVRGNKFNDYLTFVLHEVP